MRTYLKGHAAWEDENPAAVRSRGSLRKVGQLVCEFHDITVGTDLAGKHATRDRDEAITKALGGFMRQVRSEPAGDASCQA